MSECPASDYLRTRGIRAAEIWSWLVADNDVFCLPPDPAGRRELEQLFKEAFRGLPPRLGSWACGFVARDGDLSTRAIQRVLLTPKGEKLRRSGGQPYYKPSTGELGGAYFRTNGDRPLVVCEGPEDALTIRQVTGQRVMAKLGPLCGVRVEDFPHEDEIVIAIDRDPESSFEARRGTWQAIERLARQRIGILVATPPPIGSGKSDWNALLQASRTSEIRDAIQHPEPAENWLKQQPEQRQSRPAKDSCPRGRAMNQ